MAAPVGRSCGLAQHHPPTSPWGGGDGGSSGHGAHPCAGRTRFILARDAS